MLYDAIMDDIVQNSLKSINDSISKSGNIHNQTILFNKVKDNGLYKTNPNDQNANLSYPTGFMNNCFVILENINDCMKLNPSKEIYQKNLQFFGINNIVTIIKLANWLLVQQSVDTQDLAFPRRLYADIEMHLAQICAFFSQNASKNQQLLNTVSEVFRRAYE